jgi:hypothetical protein
MMARTLRRNSKARSWVGKKIKQLETERYPHEQAVVIAINEAKKYGLIRNPEEEAELVEDNQEEAEEVARGFHGRENREIFEIEEEVQYRENLACLGEMLELEVFIETRQDEGLVSVCFKRKPQSEIVFLNCSGDRKQLYLVGDTGLPDDWLEEANPSGWEKDKVPIGWVYSISYFADKHHLTGSKQQAKGSEYIHAFGEQTFQAPNRFEGIWKLEEKITGGLLPELVYDRLNEGMELIGGGYVVKDEGIWD